MIRERMERSHTIMAKWIKKLLGLAESAVPLQVLFIILKSLKKMRAKILTMTLKMKILILTMIFNRSTENTLI